MLREGLWSTEEEHLAQNPGGLQVVVEVLPEKLMSVSNPTRSQDLPRRERKGIRAEETARAKCLEPREVGKE